jgi:hypothetical protein
MRPRSLQFDFLCALFLGGILFPLLVEIFHSVRALFF